METIIGAENLRDEYRKAKLKNGDLRGLKNKFELAAKFGIPEMQIAFYSMGGARGRIGDGDISKVEIEFQLSNSTNDYLGNGYTLKELNDCIENLNGEVDGFEGYFSAVKWNKYGTDASREVVTIFQFKYK